MIDAVELECKASAMIGEVIAQRNSALDRCMALAGELAVAKAQIAELESNDEMLK